MKKVFKAKITFNITSEHPDSKYVSDLEKPLEFEDTYYIDPEFYGGGSGDMDSMIASIKNDLRLVAGGGYDTKHIKNVEFDIEHKHFMTTTTYH